MKTVNPNLTVSDEAKIATLFDQCDILTPKIQSLMAERKQITNAIEDLLYVGDDLA